MGTSIKLTERIKFAIPKMINYVEQHVAMRTYGQQARLYDQAD